jgi:hypothetical protein
VGAETDNPTSVVGKASEPMEPAGVASRTPSEELADGAERNDDKRTGLATGGPCDDGLTEAAERTDSQNVRERSQIQ